MNTWDLLILAIVAALVGIAIWRMKRRKASGCHGACTCCEGCPSAQKASAAKTGTRAAERGNGGD